ncbi:MAG: response regulator transcription factor [Saprospiraceae bacterium]|nr:response regulator transcription factor [Saprospiraceae bacterium]
MRAYIIEDEPLGLNRLVKLLEEIDPKIKVIGHAETIKSAVWWLQNNAPPDLVFMDIELADGQCFEIFKQVTIQAPVIFTTSYDEYALQAFKVNSLDYLLKPVRKDELIRSIGKYRHLQSHFGQQTVSIQLESLLNDLQQRDRQPNNFRNRFLVKQGQRLLSVETQEIAWFNADGKIVLMMTWSGQRYLVDYTLDQLDNLLDPDSFFRANRSYILHFKCIRTIHPYFHGKLKLVIHPAPEESEVVVSKEKSPDFKSWLGK